WSRSAGWWPNTLRWCPWTGRRSSGFWRRPGLRWSRGKRVPSSSCPTGTRPTASFLPSLKNDEDSRQMQEEKCLIMWKTLGVTRARQGRARRVEEEGALTRVLIADNNVELCEILDRYLSSQPDVTVVGTAYDGEQCLAMIAEHQPDVVILDITMPKLDGIAVMERLATLGVQPRPRVIVLTAMGREDIIQRLTALGADYFVVKPFNLDVLVERIRQCGPGGSQYTVVKEESAAAQYPVTVDWESQVTQMRHELGIPPLFKG